MKALVLADDVSRAALAAGRALHAGGWTVGIGSPHRALAARSRTCSHWHPVTPAGADLEGFAAEVRGVVTAHGYEIVFGCGDAEVLALSAIRDSLEAVFPYPPHATVVRAMDKLDLTATARELGIPVPATFEDQLPEDWDQPVIVKARLRAQPEDPQASGFLNTSLARDRREAHERGEEIRRRGGIPLFQEVVSGGMIACVALAGVDGVPVAEIGQESQRIWPAEAGISTRARTVAPSPDVSSWTRALLKSLGWFGMAQLQFVAPPQGPPRLIDFNGRFYGSMALAVAAGPNLPAWWAALATRRSPPPDGSGRSGVRYQWLEGDLRRALESDRHRVREVVGCLRYAPGAAHSIWDRGDPVPAVGHAAAVVGGTARKGLRWSSSRSSTR